MAAKLADAEDLPIARQTIPALLDRQAERLGDAPLLRMPMNSYSYGQLRDAVAARAGSLTELGFVAGDRVAMISSNRAETVELLLAAMWLGVIVVPLNVAVRGASLEHMLANSGARALIVEEDHIEALDGIERELPELETVWLLGASSERECGRFAAQPLPGPGDPVASVDAKAGETAAILYTSGTTGPSKGVCCPHGQLYLFGRHATQLLDLSEEDVLHTTLPLFHINAMSAVFQAMLADASLVVEPRFSASRFWHRLHESRATVTYLLGAMVRMVVNQEPSDLERGHRVRLALAPATPPQLHEVARERFGIELIEGYASTETNVAIGSPPGAGRAGMMGAVREGFSVRVADGNDAEVADGTPGELLLRHHEPFAFANGYYRMPEKTVEAWRNLWFHTGDRVVREADGMLRFVDRLKESIRRRGENISSWEVEQVLLSHPDVAEAAVFPVPSELGEDEVMATVIPTADGSLDLPELVSHCGSRLAAFAIPRFIDVATELPLTESGKVKKFALSEQGVGAGTWDREARSGEKGRN